MHGYAGGVYVRVVDFNPIHSELTLVIGKVVPGEMVKVFFFMHD